MAPHTFPSALFHVRTSEIHGKGVFATRALCANTKLGRYEGRHLSAAEMEVMEWNSSLTYLFGLSDGTVIDGAQGGNALRHLNHSCSPNCEAVELRTTDGTLQLEILTLREVLSGQELCIDSALDVDPAERSEAYRCMCLSEACRGTMVNADREGVPT
jgi:SET domain-containing protein